MLSGMDTPSPERTVSAQVEAWKALLRGVCQSGQMSEGRFDAYCRKIRPFVEWIGPGMAIDAIDEAKLEGFYTHLTEKVGAKAYSPATAHEIMMTAKQFIRRLAEMKLIHLPGNIDSRRFRFNHSAPARIEVFTVEEVRELLGKAPERMRLYLLLMVQCGMYQNDIAELRQDEVDWKAGTIKRARSKTRERNGPVVTYKLWPETFDLLRKYRSDGELVLTTEKGNPLVSYKLVDGKLKRYDAIQSAWTRMGKGRLGMKHLRKTGATLLGQHPHYKFFANHFLADSPKTMADKHYVVPSQAEFDRGAGVAQGAGAGVSMRPDCGRFERRSTDGFEPRRHLSPSHWGGYNTKGLSSVVAYPRRGGLLSFRVGLIYPNKSRTTQ